MTLTYRPRRRLTPARATALAALALLGVTGLAMISGAQRLERWFGRGHPTVDRPPATATAGRRAPRIPARTLAAWHVAPTTCCDLERIATVDGRDGCTWRVASWRDAPSTRVPESCAAGAAPVRGTSGVTLSTIWLERGAEGCMWLAAGWHDGIVTRAPTRCAGNEAVPRRSLPAADCYAPAEDDGRTTAPARQDASRATALLSAPIRRGAATTSRSLFGRCRVVSFYGRPGVPTMGALGAGDPDEVIGRLRAISRDYAADPGRRAPVPGLHMVVAVAQSQPQEDGSYLLRMPAEMLQLWIDAAEREDALVFLDVQVGRSTVRSELAHIAPLLRNGRVHVALDPEFAMPPGVAPGEAVGSLDAAAINEAQRVLQDVVLAEGLPNKILVVHQFARGMIEGKEHLENQPNVDLVIDMDGYGPSATKLAHYDTFVRRERAPFAGIKLFFGQDPDLLEPERVLSLHPPPDVVIYQ